MATTVDPLFLRNVGMVAREKERHSSPFVSRAVNLFSKHRPCTHTRRGRASSMEREEEECNSMKKGLNQRREKSIIYGRDSSRLRVNCFYRSEWVVRGTDH